MAKQVYDQYRSELTQGRPDTWYDPIRSYLGTLPEWDTTLSGTPEDAAFVTSELAKDFTPVIGEYRSGVRSTQEYNKMMGLLDEGDYTGAISPAIWSLLEGVDVGLSTAGLSVLAAPIDITRAIKRGVKSKKGVAKITSFGGEVAEVRESVVKAFQEASPEVQRMLKYFTKEELELMQPQTVTKMEGLIHADPTTGTTVGDPRILPGGSRFDPKEIAAMAYAGRIKKGWYKNTSVAVRTLFKDDTEQFVALLASMSPQISVEGNLENALNVWVRWDAAGRPTDQNSIVRIMGEGVQKTPLENRGLEALESLSGKLGTPVGTQDEMIASIRAFQESSPQNAELVRRKSVMDNWVNNSIRSLSGERGNPIRLSGAKVNSFRQNILGDPTEITNDTWESVAVGITKNVLSGSRRKFTTELERPSIAGPKKYEITEELEYKSPGYIASSAQHRKAAEILTSSKVAEGEWTGAEVQESVWSFVKAVMEQRGAVGETRKIPEIIKDTKQLDKIIADIPDFATLLHTGQFSEILEGAGYGERLQELRNIPQIRTKGAAGDTSTYRGGALRRAGRGLEKIYGRKGSKKPDDTAPVSLAGLRVIGGPEDAAGLKLVIKDISERYGTTGNPIDKKTVQIYNLDPLIGNNRIDDYLNSKGFNYKYFSFEEDPAKGIGFVIPNLSKEGYHSQTLWIYHPGVEAASFKDVDYTKAWRLTHEFGHAVAERFVQAKYGASARDGRLGAPMTNLRGKPPNQVKVELRPLTLMEAQRSVEWEDVAFRSQRKALEDLGVKVSDEDFIREYNINIKGAVQRILSGKFDDPIDEGFRPFINKQADLKSILKMLENTEKKIAKAQGRVPTEGIDLKTWKAVDNLDLRGAVDNPIVVPRSKRRVAKKTDKTDMDFIYGLLPPAIIGRLAMQQQNEMNQERPGGPGLLSMQQPNEGFGLLY